MFFFFLFRLNFKLLSVGSTATGLRGEYGGGRLDLLSRSGVPSRSPGLMMTGVSRRNRPRGLLLSPLAPALEFQRSFRATGSSPLPGKIRTFRARRILGSLGLGSGVTRARRPPGGAGRRATTGTTRQAWAEASALPRHLLRDPQDLWTLQPCEVASYAKLSAWLASWLLSPQSSIDETLRLAGWGRHHGVELRELF